MNKNDRLGKNQEYNRNLKWLPLIALALVLSPLAVRAGTLGDLTYSSDGASITITDCSLSATNISIPNIIDELPVTSIRNSAFYNCTNLTSITIPDNVTSIEGSAFSDCSSLTDVVFGNSVTSIGNGAFSGCSSLTDMVLGNSVTSIEIAAFLGCTNLVSITLPDNITSIGWNTFGNCSSLVSIMIPDSVTSIGSSAFLNCTSLTNVFLNNGITNIESRAFGECDSLPEISVDPENVFYTSQDGVLFNKDLTMLIQCPAGKEGSYEIPGTVTNIGLFAFRVTRLTNVDIPANVTSIGPYAFEWSTHITAINVDETNPAFSSLAGVLFNKDQTTLIQYPGGKTNSSYSIPEGTDTIGRAAFAFSLNLSDIMIPDSVTNIEAYAFRDCYGLTSVVIPDSVSSFGFAVFRYCTSLSSVFFAGNAPGDSSSMFYDAPSAIAYYLPDTSGWETTAEDYPSVLWNPQIQLGAGYGATTNGYSFNITGTADIPIAIEACTNLAEGIWIQLQNGTLSGGSLDFTDPDWTNYPARAYRIAAP